jgi:hypothetical protein
MNSAEIAEIFDQAIRTEASLMAGSSPYKGAQVDRVLIASTRHMPDPEANLEAYSWGTCKASGIEWFFAYEEPVDDDMPQWLMDLCLLARAKYHCNWILLDPDACPFDDLPTYDH